MVWTVNKPEQMMEVWDLASFRQLLLIYVQCYRWGVQAIITDTTQVWLDLRKELQGMHTQWLATSFSLSSRGLQQGNRIRPTLPIPLPRVLQPSSNGYRYPPEEAPGEDRWSI